MDKPHPVDELKGLRQFLEGLESGKTIIRSGGKDVTRYEITILKREIAHLERIIARSKSGGKNA
jgi:hypothetical protein